MPPEIITINAPVDDPLDYLTWITDTMAGCHEENGSRLRKTTLAMGTIIASLPDDEPTSKIYDLRELTIHFFNRFFAIHKVASTFSIVHLDESNPHVHIWATPSPKQYENGRWNLGKAFCLAGRELKVLQDMYWREVGVPLGFDRKNKIPQGRRFSRNTLKALQSNPMALRYSPQYEAGFLNALDRIARMVPLPPDLLFEVVRDELDDTSVDLLRKRLALSDVEIEHYTLREQSRIEPINHTRDIQPKTEM